MITCQKKNIVLLFKHKHTWSMPEVVGYTCNPSTLEVEGGGSEIQGEPWIHREF